MKHPLSTLLVSVLGLAVGAQAQAACTAGNPNANMPESTPTSAFVVNGDGTVTHNLTGLTWKQCAQGQSGAGCTGTATTLTWSGALASATADATAGGGWRLPNARELRSIIESCGYSAAINQTIFPATDTVKAYWTSSSYVAAPGVAWQVDFANGSGGVGSKSATYNVRLVRGGQTLDSYDAQNNTIATTFSFTSQTNVAPSTVITSNTITVAGLSGSSPITVTGGTYSINGGAYTSAAGTVSNGDTVTVQLTSSSAYSYMTSAILAIGGNSATFSVTTMQAPGVSQTLSLLPISIPGLTSLPSIVSFGSGIGPNVASRLASGLSVTLGMPLQYIGQSAQGAVSLSGYNGGNLAFMPLSYQTGDTRATGIYAVGNGQYQAVFSGQSVLMAPSLVHLDQLLALLPGVAATLTDNGVIVASYNGLIYAVLPSVAVQTAPATGKAQLIFGNDGMYHFIDAQGNGQTLYPAFAESASLRNLVPSIFPGSTATMQLDGTAVLTINGQYSALVPDITLGGIPSQRAGQSWWQETAKRYRLLNVQLPVAIGTSQGFTVWP